MPTSSEYNEYNCPAEARRGVNRCDLDVCSWCAGLSLVRVRDGHVWMCDPDKIEKSVQHFG